MTTRLFNNLLKLVPMLSEKITGAFNTQLSLEFGATHHYMALSVIYANAGYPMLARCFRRKWKQKLMRGEALIDYVLRRGAKVNVDHQLASMPHLKSDASLTDVFNAVLTYEHRLLEGLQNLCALCSEEKDFAAFARVIRLVEESREQLNRLEGIVRELRTCQGKEAMMYMMEMGHRMMEHMHHHAGCGSGEAAGAFPGFSGEAFGKGKCDCNAFTGCGNDPEEDPALFHYGTCSDQTCDQE